MFLDVNEKQDLLLALFAKTSLLPFYFSCFSATFKFSMARVSWGWVGYVDYSSLTRFSI